jgi:hypothetical protein
MFEYVEKHKRTSEEKRTILFEVVAALAAVALIGVAVWLVFLKSGG